MYCNENARQTLGIPERGIFAPGAFSVLFYMVENDSITYRLRVFLLTATNDARASWHGQEEYQSACLPDRSSGQATVTFANILTE